MTESRGGAKAVQAGYPLHDLIAARWSPHGFDAGHELTDQQVGSLLEAARWSPSSTNSQPWYMIVARRGSDDFARIVATLSGNNQLWAPSASALIVMCARLVNAEGKPQRWAMYDAGQAAAHLSIQAEAMGLSVHQMGGFKADELSASFGLADDLQPMAVIAVGQFSSDVELPEFLAKRETAARTRRPLSDTVHGGWPR